MKFSDVVTAVASLVVISILLDSVFSALFVLMLPTGGTCIAGILSILVASLIVGYVFALKIQEESRRGAIGSIVVLSAVVLMFLTLLCSPSRWKALRLRRLWVTCFKRVGGQIMIGSLR